MAASIIEAVRAKVKRRSGIDKEPDWPLFQKHLTSDEIDTYLFAVDKIASAALREPDHARPHEHHASPDEGHAPHAGPPTSHDD